jgi:hypothetical protein
MRGDFEKRLWPVRVEGNRMIRRFARKYEAMQMEFKGSISKLYGISSTRRYQGEQSRKDLQLRWDLEMASFRVKARPIQNGDGE